MKEDARIYVRWTGDQLIKAITVSGVGINELMTPLPMEYLRGSWKQ